MTIADAFVTYARARMKETARVPRELDFDGTRWREIVIDPWHVFDAAAVSEAWSARIGARGVVVWHLRPCPLWISGWQWAFSGETRALGTVQSRPWAMACARDALVAKVSAR